MRRQTRDSPAASACAGSSTCSSRCTRARSSCSRRTRARAARCRSWRRRPASPSSGSPAASRSASASPTSARRVPDADRRGGQGGGAAVRPLPRRRPPARAGDALDRRGHGARARLRRPPSPRRRAPPGSRCRTRPNGRRARGVPVRQRPRQAGRDAARPAAPRPRLPLCATPGTARAIAPARHRRSTEVAKVGDAHGRARRSPT